MVSAHPRPHVVLAAGVALLLSASAQAETRIGFAHPLSGPYASSGHRQQVAVELAVHDLNLDGGVLGDQVELVVADDACGIERAASAAKKLIDAGVDVVIGHMCSHSSLIAAGYYETAGVLMITPSSTHPRLTEEGRRNVFRMIGRDDRQGQLAAQLLADRHAGERIAILHDGTTYGAGLAGETRNALRKLDVEEALFVRYQPNLDDQGDLVERLIAEQIAVAYIGGYGPDAARILQAAHDRQFDLTVIGGDALAMDEFWTIAGELGEGTVFSSRAAEPLAAEHVLAGLEERGLGKRPGGVAAYAAIEAWAKAAERVGTDEPARVAAMLRRGRFDTALGRVTFDNKGDLEQSAWAWHVWQDGAYHKLDPLPPTQ